MKFIKSVISIIILFFTSLPVIFAQDVLVESVAAIVGQEMILLSTIEDKVLQEKLTGDTRPLDEIRCDVLENSLITKLFIDQAKIDSVTTNDAYIDSDTETRFSNALSSVGGDEKILEEYFRKSVVEIKKDIRKSLEEQSLVSNVQSSIVKDASVTPSEVRKFFASIPKDSLPIIPARVKISIIQFDVPDFEESELEARNKLLEIRNRLVEGESFSLLAAMYSEDPGSRYKGGEVGYTLRGQLDKSYADAAWNLKEGGISRIVESSFGYHIIQLIDKKGEMINTRHILIIPKVNTEQAAKAISKLDSLAQAIRRDSISFADAALRYSTHKDSRTNGGQYVNNDPSDRNRWIELDNKSLNSDMYLKIRDLKINEISEPFATTDENGKTVFRIVRLDDIQEAHKANLKDDYQLLYNATLSNKQNKIYSDWVNEKIKSTYIKISEECSSCSFLTNMGWIK